MSISNQLLAVFTAYGLPALFGIILVSSVGVPLPSSFLLIAAGSFVELGELDLGWVIALAAVAAVVGDQIGYGLGRWGGRRLVQRISRYLGGEQRMRAAEACARKWGGAGVFLTRWLITPFGAWLNLTSGIADYPYARFLLWDAAGETVWVVLYVMAGWLLSDQVQALTDAMGNLAWLAVGFIGAALLCWRFAAKRGTVHDHWIAEGRGTVRNSRKVTPTVESGLGS